MTWKSIRKFAVLAAALALALLASGALAMTPEEEDAAWKKEPAYGQTIRIGYNGALCTGSAVIAHAKGFYAAEGIETEVSKYQGDTSLQGDAVGTRKTDVTCGLIATLLVPAANGVHMKFTNGIHGGCKSLCVLTDSPYNGTKDLEGKTVSIGTPIGGSDHNIAMRFLKRDGLDPLNSVKFRVTDPGAAVLAMQSGEIAAGIFSDQFIQKFLADGTLRVIRSLTFDDDFKDETCCIHAVASALCEDSPITVKKLTRAHERARQWIAENPEETVKIMLENGWASGDPEKVTAYLKTLDFSVTDPVTEATLINVIDDYKSFGILDEGRDTKEILSRVWYPVLVEQQ